MRNLLETGSRAKDYTELHKFMAPMTLKSHVAAMISGQTTTIQLSRLRKENADQMERHVKLLFVDLAKSLNMGDKGLTPANINELSIFIPQDYYHLTLEDIYIFCQQIKRSAFGVMYNTLNTQKVMEYVKVYDERRTEEISLLRIREHQIKKQDPQGLAIRTSTGGDPVQEFKDKLNTAYAAADPLITTIKPVPNGGDQPPA